MTINNTNAGKDATGQYGANELAAGDAVLYGEAKYFGAADGDAIGVLPDAPSKGDL